MLKLMNLDKELVILNKLERHFKKQRKDVEIVTSNYTGCTYLMIDGIAFFDNIYRLNGLIIVSVISKVRINNALRQFDLFKKAIADKVIDIDRDFLDPFSRCADIERWACSRSDSEYKKYILKKFGGEA